MPVYLDDEQVDLPPGPMGAVLRAVRERLRPQGRVVVEVRLDGQPLSAEDMELQSLPDMAQCELRLFSADPRELALETLEQVRDRLAGASQMQSDAAELLQQDQASEALGKIGQANEAWLQARQALVMAADAAGLDLGALTVEGEPVKNYTTALISALTDLKTALENQDTVTLADALAYEWPTMTARWDKLIAAMIDKIEQSVSPSEDPPSGGR